MPGRLMSPSRGEHPSFSFFNHGPLSAPHYTRPLSPQNRGRPVPPYNRRALSPDFPSRRPPPPVHYRGRAPSPELYRNLPPLSPRYGERPLSPSANRGPRGRRSRAIQKMRQRQYTEQVGQIDFGDEESIPNDAHDLMERLHSGRGVQDDIYGHPRHGRSAERIIGNDFAYDRRPRDLSPRPHQHLRPHRAFSPGRDRAFSPGRDRGRERFLQERGLSPRREHHASPRREFSPRRHHNVIDDLNNGIYGPPIPVSKPEAPIAQQRRKQNQRRNGFSPPPPHRGAPIISQDHFRPTSPAFGPRHAPPIPLPGMARPPPGVVRPHPVAMGPPHAMSPPLRYMGPPGQVRGPPHALGLHNGFIAPYPVVVGPRVPVPVVGPYRRW